MEEKKKIYPKLFLLVGPSGCGKNFYCESLKLTNIPSYTTRDIRPGEVDGREHIFKTFKDWDKILSSKNFEKQIVAWTIFHDNVYWTLMSDINKKEYDAFIIDPKGIDILLKYKKKYPDVIKRELVIIQFKAKKHILFKRIYNRMWTFKKIFNKQISKSKIENNIIKNIECFFKTLYKWTPIQNIKQVQSRLEHDIPIFKNLESRYDIAYTIYT